MILATLLVQGPEGKPSQRHVLADGEVIEYKDSATDVAFIAVVRKVSGNFIPAPASRFARARRGRARRRQAFRHTNASLRSGLQMARTRLHVVP